MDNNPMQNMQNMQNNAPVTGQQMRQSMPSGPAQEKLSPAHLWRRAMIDKFANFDGRATRGEYWYVYLINMVLAVFASVVFSILSWIAGDGFLAIIVRILLVIFYVVSLALIIPGIALAVRRLHDTNRSGWWLLLGFVPFGFIALLVFYFTAGDAGENNYGPPAAYTA